jgi:benzodiazapine receptor
MNWLHLIIVVALLALSIGIGYLTMDFQTPWYKSLQLPSFQPPPKVFQWIWPLLYIIIVVVVYNNYEDTIGLYIGLIIFLSLWSVFFFVFRNLWLSTLSIVASLVISILLYQKIRDPNLKIVFVLVLFWLTFAAVLNGNIAYMNPNKTLALEKIYV